MSDGEADIYVNVVLEELENKEEVMGISEANFMTKESSVELIEEDNQNNELIDLMNL